MEFSMYVLYDGVTKTGSGVQEDYYTYTGFDGKFMRYTPHFYTTPQEFLFGLKNNSVYDYRNYNLSSKNIHTEEEIIEYVKSLMNDNKTN